MANEYAEPYPFPVGPIVGPGAHPQDKSGDSIDFPFLGVYTQETTQRYMLGTRYITWDGRVFKYAKASGTLFVGTLCVHTLKQEVFYNNVTANYGIGTYQVKVDIESTDADGSGNIDPDALAGGYVLVFDATDDSGHIRGIVSNDAVVTGTTDVTLDLDAPWHLAITTDDHAEIMASPYYGVGSGGMSQAGHLGAPVVKAVSGEFCWIQSWGPTWLVPQTNVGSGGNAVCIVIREDGSADCRNATIEADTDKRQIGGFVLSHNAGAQALPFVMLTISI